MDFFWGEEMFGHTLKLLFGPPQFGASHYAVSTHSCLIILVTYGPACAQLILLGERKSGLESHLAPTTVNVHAVLLFRGRMICREMRDEEEVPLH